MIALFQMNMHLKVNGFCVKRILANVFARQMLRLAEKILSVTIIVILQGGRKSYIKEITCGKLHTLP